MKTSRTVCECVAGWMESKPLRCTPGSNVYLKQPCSPARTRVATTLLATPLCVNMLKCNYLPLLLWLFHYNPLHCAWLRQLQNGEIHPSNGCGCTGSKSIKAYQRISTRWLHCTFRSFFQASLLPRSAHLTRDCAGVDATRDENAQGAVESF